jgi:hypothetical protein
MVYADKIRSLTNEQLAFYLFDRCGNGEYCHGICAYEYGSNQCVFPAYHENCIKGITEWLNLPAYSKLELGMYHDEEEVLPDGVCDHMEVISL